MRKRGRIEREGLGGLEVQIRKGERGERWGGESREERGRGIRTIFGMEIPYINFPQINRIRYKSRQFFLPLFQVLPIIGFFGSTPFKIT